MKRAIIYWAGSVARKGILNNTLSGCMPRRLFSAHLLGPLFRRLPGREGRSGLFYLCCIAAAVFCLLAPLLAVPDTALADNWYVSPLGDDDYSGRSWNEAFRTIRRGVQAARTAGDIVILDNGTFSGSENRNIHLESNLDVVIQSRNGPQNTTIDLQNSGRAFNFHGENSAVLDGLTIINGSSTNGGALYVNGSAGVLPVISNCRFRNNYASGDGGAIYIDMTVVMSSRVVIRSCIFSSNNANNRGGAVGVRMSGDPPAYGDAAFEVDNCSFSENSALQGGAIGSSQDEMVISSNYSVVKNSRFFSNTALQGGAISLGTVAYISVTHCFFSYNTAIARGGAASSLTGSSFVNSIFFKNTAYVDGGAIWASCGDAVTSVVHCSFANNSALEQGGGIRIKGNMDLVSSILWGNHAGDKGQQVHFSDIYPHALNVDHSNIQGGLAGMFDPADPNVTASSLGGNLNSDPVFALAEDLHLMPGSPCIDAGNNAAVPVDSFDLDNDSIILEPLPYDLDQKSRVLDETVDMGAYEYDAAEIPAAAVSPERLFFTAREGGSLPEGQALFVKNRGPGTLEWEVLEDIPWLRLEPDRGISTDDTGEVMIYIDHLALSHGIYTGILNVHESGGPAALRAVEVTLHVTAALKVPADYATIQSAIDDAIHGDEVVVADGTYTGTGNRGLDFLGKRIKVRSAQGPEFTVIDCENADRGFFIHRGETAESVLQGFTITRGYATERGGGMRVGSNASPTILGCIFLNNYTADDGGGLCLEGSQSFVAQCRFEGNSSGTASSHSGGGLAVFGNYNTIESCVFSSNSAAGYGGGLYGDYSTDFLTVNGCQFTGNTSAYYGGGICLANSLAEAATISSCVLSNNSALYGGGVYINDATIYNCIFQYNSATNYGGGIYSAYNSTIGVTNCTFHQNSVDTSNGGAGLYAAGSDAIANIKNSIFWINRTSSPAVLDDLQPTFTSGIDVTYCTISDSSAWPASAGDHIINDDPMFLDDDGPDDDLATWDDNDLRLDKLSPCIDMGDIIPWLFSDIRGSARPVDGDGEGAAGFEAGFDMGAYEYSLFYGGLPGDQAAKAFKNFQISGGPVMVTNFDYEISWLDRDPFPADPRIAQGEEYSVNIALVNTYGMRVELGTYSFQTMQAGYSIPVSFSPKHIGTWRLRIELTTDPNMYALSEMFLIYYKPATRYALSQWIQPPEDADPTVKPDLEEEHACFWSEDTQRLYAVAPTTTVITWYADENKTTPIPVVAYITYPDKDAYPSDPDTMIHIADSMAVDLLPDGTRFDMAQILYRENDAAISGNVFSAGQEGWVIILYKDQHEENPDENEVFDVVVTYAWDHAQNPDIAPHPVLNPAFPFATDWDIGTKLTDPDHCADCKSGWVFFEHALYDGSGPNRAYDRSVREGPIFAVNEDDPTIPADDLVALWYSQSAGSGVCWPSKPVHYDAQWPADARMAVIAGGLGSGPLPQNQYGLLDNMLVYNQPDRSMPGYNANEEHADFFTAQGSDSPAVFPLRTDLNVPTDDLTEYGPGDRSRPYVLLKYQDPDTAEWEFEVFKVVAESKSYILQGGLVTEQATPANTYYIAADGTLTQRSGALPDPSYYLNDAGLLVSPAGDGQSYNLNTGTGLIEAVVPGDAKNYYMDNLGDLLENTGTLPEESYALDAHGVIVESDVYYRFHYSGIAGQEINPPYPLNQMTFGPCTESYTSTPSSVLKDKDDKFFAKHGGHSGEETQDVVLNYFYRLQPGFFYDLDENGVADEAAGTPVPWLEGLDDVFEGEPVEAVFAIRWPDPVPTLFVGETLTDAKTQDGETVGLPNVKNQCVVQVLFDQAIMEATGISAKLIDPLLEHAAPYDAGLPAPLEAELDFSGRWIFKALPSHIQSRLTWDPETEEIKIKGLYSVSTGEPMLVLNTLTERDIMEIARPFLPSPNSLDPADPTVIDAIPADFRSALYALKDVGDTGLIGKTFLKDAEIKALTAGNAYSAPSYVTLAFNNDMDCPGPTTLSVMRVGCPLYRGEIKVIEPEDAFEEKVTLRHNGDFGGKPGDRWFQWKYLTADFSGIPVGPDQPDENWKNYFAVLQNPGSPARIDFKDSGEPVPFYEGAVDVTVMGTGQQLLPDKWFATRYYLEGVCAADPYDPEDPGCYSQWTRPQLYEGWIKRVMKNINLFDQKVKAFHESEAGTLADMISLAGTRYEGDVALSSDPDNLCQLGIIETYHTLLERGKALSIDQGEGIDLTDINKSILFAANRLTGIYITLGNEAYADAQDPTIGFSTEDGQYGMEAPSVFCFQNQVDSLLDEELALLRGRDDEGSRPFYNRLIWNFTEGSGETAYKESYNITDQKTDQDGIGCSDAPDGTIDARDAMVMFPQGHGDAWGHYLTGIKYYYDLLRHPSYTWSPQSEAILVEQTPVEVDYRDERRFADVAAAKARTGAEIVNLTYSRHYVEDPEEQWQGYKDTDADRAWGVSGWASRAGQGAFFDWVVGTAILPPETVHPAIPENQTAATGQTAFVLEFIRYNPETDPRILQVFVNDVLQDISEYEVSCDTLADPIETTVTFAQGLNLGEVVHFELITLVEGIQRIDRTTVVELGEISAQYMTVQTKVDEANLGLNPLGVAEHVVPFDIDPGEISRGQTHFEQIFERAVQAMNNAIAVFNHANQSTMLLRRQQDSLADFQRNIENAEADSNNRLVEVFGYPFPDDCGPGKTYPTGYCQEGPDLYHYMYVDSPELMGLEHPQVYQFPVTFREIEPDASGSFTTSEKNVLYHLDAEGSFGLIKPLHWQARRKAPGEIQMARTEILLTRGRFEKALVEYDNLMDRIDRQLELIQMQSALNAEEIYILETAKGKQKELNSWIKDSRAQQLDDRRTGRIIQMFQHAAAEAIPKEVGFSVDAFSVLRGALYLLSAGLNEMYSYYADSEAISELGHQHAKDLTSAQSNIDLTAARSSFAIEQQLLQLKNIILEEAPLRLEIYNLAESMRQSAQRYLSSLAKGGRLLQDRLRFRRQTAAQIQNYRYKDMTFRIFRNDALQKYRAQFDMAARYVYLAARAYDYETTLLDHENMAGQHFLTDIVRQRTIGMIEGGLPLTGSGLADPMKRMWQNFQVIKPQLGFSNPQVETNRFSLREELYRVRMDTASNDIWRQVLEESRVDDLWDVPEFRRYCRPFAPEGIPEPGLVIPFDTTVTSRLNFFGWTLGGGDSFYSASNFATKVRSTGVWFTNYNSIGLAETPRIYLVPVGEDVLRTPSYNLREIRTWQVVDQKMPIPFPIVNTEMQNDPGWIPTVDTVFDEMFQIRRHSDFRAYHDSGYVNESEMSFDSRLIGRSVWNTRWLLIIPGSTLLYDPDEGLDTLIHGPHVIGGDPDERTGYGITDIKLFFHTYAYSGN